MRVLTVHCEYRSGKGGEDTVIRAEVEALANRGHTVSTFRRSNAAISRHPFTAIFRALFSTEALKSIRHDVETTLPDIIHVHNTAFAMSPSILWVSPLCSVPIVLTLHNYRLFCANGFALRGGVPCVECLSRLPLPALRHGCRHGGSRLHGALSAAVIALHRLLGTYRHVASYIVFSEFHAKLFERHGIGRNKIAVKPNFIAKAGTAPNRISGAKTGVVCISQMIPEKGVDLLLAAWKLSEGAAKGPLILVGRGHKEDSYRRLAERLSIRDISWIPHMPQTELLSLVGAAKWLVLASRWYEGCPMVLLEAMSLGTPVIVPAHGGLPELIGHGDAGITFTPNDEKSLAAALERAGSMSEEKWAILSQGALARAAKLYSAGPGYQNLITVYASTIERARTQAEEAQNDYP